MAKVADNLVLRLLREIRSSQLEVKSDVSDMKKKIDDLYKISTHSLGFAANAHLRYETLEASVHKLEGRVKRLEAKV